MAQVEALDSSSHNANEVTFKAEAVNKKNTRDTSVLTRSSNKYSKRTCFPWAK